MYDAYFNNYILIYNLWWFFFGENKTILKGLNKKISNDHDDNDCFTKSNNFHNNNIN